MTAALVLLTEVRAAGVQLGLKGGKLLIEVPRGALTAAQRERLVEHRVEIAALLTEPAGDRYGPDEVVADLKTVFTVTARRAMRRRNDWRRPGVADGPVGDDLPAWQAWMNRRYTCGGRAGSRGPRRCASCGARRREWHKRHGAAPDPDRCAGCGERMLAGAGIRCWTAPSCMSAIPRWSSALPSMARSGGGRRRSG